MVFGGTGQSGGTQSLFTDEQQLLQGALTERAGGRAGAFYQQRESPFQTFGIHKWTNHCSLTHSNWWCVFVGAHISVCLLVHACAICCAEHIYSWPSTAIL